METITIVWKPITTSDVGNTGTATGTYHEFLLYRDSAGAEYYVRAGAQSRVDGAYPSGDANPFGNIRIDGGVGLDALPPSR
jgi:hypothetical protein